MKETYKTIKDYPNYEVSDLGNVRNIKTGRVLKPDYKGGYQYAALCKEGKPKSHLIHRLVASAFIPNPENKPQVNHVNGDKTDNHIENLEWATNSENQKHAIKTGLRTKSGRSKQKVRCIETNREFESQHDAAKYFGCGQGSIQVSINKGYTVLKKYHFELV